MIRPMEEGAPEAQQFRCSACGNLTRFDVTVSRRVKEFRHFSVGGDLTVESTDVLEERVDLVECRWCRASGDAIELRSAGAADGAEAGPGAA
jgi:hypothetical protein